MAKALLGTFHSDQRTAAHLVSENTRLRVRVRDLEELISRLQDENDRLAPQAFEGARFVSHSGKREIGGALHDDRRRAGHRDAKKYGEDFAHIKPS